MSPTPIGRHGVTVHQDQTAQIDGRTVALESSVPATDDRKYVRAITPPPVRTPRTLHLDFARSVPGTLLDVDGRGIGLDAPAARDRDRVCPGMIPISAFAPTAMPSS